VLFVVSFPVCFTYGAANVGDFTEVKIMIE
jgi:hypothetical protein